jgi:TatD DNase family protein
MLFDTHAHYYDAQFYNGVEEAIARARENGVGYILTASCDVASSVENISLTQKYDIFYAAVGVHPHNAADQNSRVLTAIAEFATYPRVVAIGEIGLDYYYDNSPRDVQKTWFAKQIALARKVKLPIIVHDRDAHEDTVSILKSENAADTGGVLHCFTGSVEMARQVMDLGFMISIAGPVTFKNARKILEVVKFVPDDMLLIETDSPYLTPEPYRGKRNESAYVKLIAEKIAKIKGRSVEYIEETTTSNAKKLFGIQ